MEAPRLEALFPCAVALECGDPALVEGALHPLEATLLERVAEKRRRELVAGRVLARRALTRLGLPAGPVLRDGERAPRWPAGAVGSISHDAGRVAVVVARAEQALALGLDLEDPRRMKARLLPSILTEAERARIDAAPPERRMLLAALVFSAKESVYKCQHPLARRWLGFHDVELELDLEAASFEARTVADLAPLWPAGTRAVGRLAFDADRVATAVTLLRVPR